MKKFIIDYFNFVNEGAYLTPPNYTMVNLSILNDPKKPLEVLKSNGQGNIAGFRKTGTSAGGSFQLYYGLSVDPARQEKLGNNDPIFKITLDALKRADINNANQDLPRFLKKSVDLIKNNKRSIEYVVSLGSTAGLSSELGKEFSKQLGAKHIPLSKYTYDNFGKSLNWKYIKDYDNKPDAAPILGRVKTEIINKIDDTRTDAATIAAIRLADSGEKLEKILLYGNPNYRYERPTVNIGNDQVQMSTIYWKDEPFMIRSSNLSFGGSRNWGKTKYDTPKETGEYGDPAFMEAVRECITTNSKMLIVDDNARTREDISKLFDTISKMADYLKDDETLNAKSISTFPQRFLAYVLIYIPEKGEDLGVKKLISQTELNTFKQTGLDGISKWIEDNNKKKG